MEEGAPPMVDGSGIVEEMSTLQPGSEGGGKASAGRCISRTEERVWKYSSQAVLPTNVFPKKGSRDLGEI